MVENTRSSELVLPKGPWGNKLPSFARFRDLTRSPNRISHSVFHEGPFWGLGVHQATGFAITSTSSIKQKLVNL